MTNAHTPGPWIAKRTCQSGKVQILGISEGSTYTLMTISPSINKSAKRDEMQANARLIAAAPELLEVLEAAKEHMENPYPGGDDLSHILARAGAAIVKARGE